MLLLIWKSFSSLWDHNLLFIKPSIIKVDGIDRMTYFELEQEVNSNIAFVSYTTIIDYEIYILARLLWLNW